MKFILLSVFLFSHWTTIYSQNKYGYTGGGTTVFTLLTKDAIWMAADSKEVFVSKDKKDSCSHSICKIAKTKQVYYAFAGKSVSVNGFYHSDSIMKRAIIENNTFGKAIKVFDLRIKNNLKKYVNQLSRKDYLEATKTLLIEYSIVTFINGEVKLVSGGYKLLNNKSHQIINIRDTSFPEITMNYKIIGYREEILKVVNTPSHSKSVKDRLIYLIQLEVSKHPDLVGEPIDVLEITKNGYHWLTDNKGYRHF